ncbi:MAG TPA: YhcH/YjgK/YiaL family protein [Kiritimatiellia bacterium]|jgi:YhcH/YjgK/YiaL family protein
MILDRLDSHLKYTRLHGRFNQAFAFLLRPDLASIPDGRHAVDGELLYASVEHREGRGREGAKLEVHRKYIDIQFTLSGVEVIGWRSLADCSRWTEPFEAGRDVGFFAETPDTWLAIPAGHFAIFHPDDAHAPLGGTGPVHKVVMKIAV